MSPEDAAGAVRALLLLVRQTGVRVSVNEAPAEMLDALAALARAEGEEAARYVGCAGPGCFAGQEWDAVEALGILMYSAFRPAAAPTCPTCGCSGAAAHSHEAEGAVR